MVDSYLSVSDINNTAKELIENFQLFKNLYIKGEVADFKGASKNGHIYFTLKDDVCSVRAVIWKGNVTRAVKNLKNGSEVIITGKISLYNKGGYINITVYDILDKGAGDQAVKKDELYAKFESLGYFKEERKKPLPKYPERIAVITSKRGAAIGDVIRTINMRYPICKVTTIDVAVQGDNAPKEIAQAVLSSDGLYDLIFITRGGGSEEDRVAFDSKEVIEAVFNCNTPTLSAVGHDRDLSLLDLVADKNASTPTQGAVLAVPDYKAILDDLESKKGLFAKSLNNIYLQKQKDLLICTKHEGFIGFRGKVLENLKELGSRANELKSLVAKKRRELEFETMLVAERIESLSPLAVLTRGYAIAYKNDKPILDSKAVSLNEDIYVKLLKGGFKAEIKEVDYE